MKIHGYDFPDTLYYDRHHSWARVEGNMVIQGLTDLGQALAQDIIFVGLPRVNREAQQGQTLLSLESGKWVGRVPAVATGKVAEVHENLEDNPVFIHNSPYEHGWVLKIEMSDPSEIGNLFPSNSEEFERFIGEEVEKYQKVLNK